MTWYAKDGLGSVRSLMNNDGTQRSVASNSPYGGVLEQAPNWNTNMGFTGEPTDEVGLIHLRARFYNPGSGQFLSSDPLEGQVKDPRSFNRYGYVNGNPITNVDPSGKQTATPIPCSSEPDPSKYLSCLIKNYCNIDSVKSENILTCLRQLSQTVPMATASPGSCPTNAIFGCNPKTGQPIIATIISGTHQIRGDGTPLAIDFVPEGANSGVYPNWEKTAPFTDVRYRTVYAVAGGVVLNLGRGNYRVRSDIIHIFNNISYNVCFEYLHLEPSQNSPKSGQTISAGAEIGIVEPWQNDADIPQDKNKGPSHLHLAVFMCKSVYGKVRAWKDGEASERTW